MSSRWNTPLRGDPYAFLRPMPIQRPHGTPRGSYNLEQIDGARRAVIAAQRCHVSELRRDRRCLAEMLRQIERGLDLDEVRLR